MKASYESENLKIEIELKKPISEILSEVDRVMDTLLNLIDDEDWFVMISKNEQK